MAEIKVNPANPAPSLVDQFASGERKRVPMTLPKSKLSVPDIPGYHLHWFADRQGGGRIIQAMHAGYEHVDMSEVSQQEFGLGSDASRTRNDDLGTRVSVIGGAGEGNVVERLYLMKIRQEWWEEDQAGLQERNQSIMDTIKRTGVKAEGESANDSSKRYVKTAEMRTTTGRKAASST